MMDNTQNMIRQLQQNKDTLLQLMRSPDGQRLMQLLTQQAGGNGLKRAAGSAATGNTEELTRMIQQLMRHPEGAELVERINRSIQGKQG